MGGGGGRAEAVGVVGWRAVGVRGRDPERRQLGVSADLEEFVAGSDEDGIGSPSNGGERGGEGRPAEFLGELVDPALSFEVGFCFAELER
jgi:hypothetical protein